MSEEIQKGSKDLVKISKLISKEFPFRYAINNLDVIHYNFSIEIFLDESITNALKNLFTL